jgi:hypothetical protein
MIDFDSTTPFARDPRATTRTGQNGSVAFELALAHTKSFAT